MSHEMISIQVSLYSRALNLQADDVIVSWLPLYHDMGFMACFLLPCFDGRSVGARVPFEWVSRPQVL